MTAAVLKTFKLIIIGSICGTQSNRYPGRTFPRLAHSFVYAGQTVGPELYAE